MDIFKIVSIVDDISQKITDYQYKELMDFLLYTKRLDERYNVIYDINQKYLELFDEMRYEYKSDVERLRDLYNEKIRIHDEIFNQKIEQLNKIEEQYKINFLQLERLEAEYKNKLYKLRTT